MTTELGLWVPAIREKCIEGKKVFITCSQRSMAEVLRSFIVDRCRPSSYGDVSGWEKKVALITGTTILPSDSGMRRAEDFVTYFSQFDVAVVTFTLESGVSLSRHYELVFCFCSRMPITFPCQVQLAHRVRDCERILIYAEKGLVFRFFQDKKALVQLVSAPLQFGYESLLASTVAVVLSEEADTFNNNHILWLENREPKQILSDGRVMAGSSEIEEGTWFSEGTDTNAVRQEALSAFWDHARARSYGIIQYMRLVAKDADIIKLVESLQQTNPMAYSIAMASGHKRDEMASLLGTTAFAFFSVHSRRCEFSRKSKAHGNLEDFKKSWFSRNALPVTLLYWAHVDHFLSLRWHGLQPEETQWSAIKTTAHARGHQNVRDLSLLGMVTLVETVGQWVIAMFGSPIPKPAEYGSPNSKVRTLFLNDLKKLKKDGPIQNTLATMRLSGQGEPWWKGLLRRLRRFTRLPLSVNWEGKFIIKKYLVQSIALSMVTHPLLSLGLFEGMKYSAFLNEVDALERAAGEMVPMLSDTKRDTRFTIGDEDDEITVPRVEVTAKQFEVEQRNYRDSGMGEAIEALQAKLSFWHRNVASLNGKM